MKQKEILSENSTHIYYKDGTIKVKRLTPAASPVPENKRQQLNIEKAAHDFAENGFDFDLALTGSEYDKRCEAFIKGAIWAKNKI